MSRFLAAGSFFQVSKRYMNQRNRLFYLNIPFPSDLLPLNKQNNRNNILFSLSLFQCSPKRRPRPADIRRNLKF